jgi:hypothetical protein
VLAGVVDPKSGGQPAGVVPKSGVLAGVVDPKSGALARVVDPKSHLKNPTRHLSIGRRSRTRAIQGF